MGLCVLYSIEQRPYFCADLFFADVGIPVQHGLVSSDDFGNRRRVDGGDCGGDSRPCTYSNVSVRAEKNI